MNIRELRDKLNNLIRNGYGDYDAVTEDMVTGSLCVLDENDDEDMFEKVEYKDKHGHDHKVVIVSTYYSKKNHSTIICRFLEKVLPTFRPSNRIGIGTGLKIRVLWVRLPPWPLWLCRIEAVHKVFNLVKKGQYLPQLL